MPDAGGEGEESCGDAGVDAWDGASAVVFEGELAFQGVKHGLDPLPDATEAPEPWVLILAVGAHQMRAELIGDEGLELASREPLVADDHLARLDEMPVVAQQRRGHFPLSELRVRESPDHGHPVGGADQIETEPPEKPGVGGAVAVAGVPGKIGAFHRLARRRARQRGGIHETGQLTPGRGVASQFGDHRGDQPRGLADPFAPPGLLRDVREHAMQVRAGVPDPLALGRDPEQVLRDQQTQQLDVVERGLTTRVMIAREPDRRQDPVIEMDVQCDQEGVEVSFHTQGLTPSASD